MVHKKIKKKKCSIIRSINSLIRKFLQINKQMEFARNYFAGRKHVQTVCVNFLHQNRYVIGCTGSYNNDSTMMILVLDR